MKITTTTSPSPAMLPIVSMFCPLVESSMSLTAFPPCTGLHTPQLRGDLFEASSIDFLFTVNIVAIMQTNHHGNDTDGNHSTLQVSDKSRIPQVPAES